MKNVEYTWSLQELTIVQHPRCRNILMLANTDELQTVLDDSNTTIVRISSSAYGSPFKSKIDDWVKSLKLFRQILDEWIDCQKVWFRLEAVFTAPDIQTSLPHEARMFSICHEKYQKELKKYQFSTLALPILTDSKMLDKLKIIRKLLEQVCQCLIIYIDGKRFAFPRLYFFSNDEVLDFLSKSKKLNEIQGYIGKCFPAVRRIEFGTKVANEICAVHSFQGEKLVLRKVIHPIKIWN